MRTIDNNKPTITLKGLFIYLFMFIINHIIGINKKKFYFEGIGGKYNDNARAVSEKMHAIYPDFKIVWAIDKPNINDIHIPSYITKSTNGFTRLYHRATSAGWISCIITSTYVYKNKKQVYVQCWHGDRPMKKILKDTGNMYIYETSHSDAMTSGSVFYTKLLDSAFNYRGFVISSGCPRNDVLISMEKERIIAVKKDLHIDENQKILLYAPTFRDSDVSTQKENLKLSHVVDLLNKKTGFEWICLGRFHPSVGMGGRFINKDVIDVTDYYDMANLLLISDIIITDYSSSATDFILTGRPVFLYQPDLTEYVSKDRNLYFNFEDTPFWTAKSQEELESLILYKTADEASENCKQIGGFYGIHETGHSSVDVVNFLLSKVYNNNEPA